MRADRAIAAREEKAQARADGSYPTGSYPTGTYTRTVLQIAEELRLLNQRLTELEAKLR
jgi:hypothetical protein